MYQNLAVYLPQDRLQALAHGEKLPDRITGSALFADISGFTPLTEQLAQTMGARRGAEELTHHLNAVYDAIIAEVQRYGGSVISFAGDAITCWFDAHLEDVTGPPAQRALACALAIQTVMEQFTNLAIPDGTSVDLTLKISVTTGPANRFVVGNATVQLIDALAGETITRLAAAEHLAQKGDVLADVPTLEALGCEVEVKSWHTHPESQERFGVITALHANRRSLISEDWMSPTGSWLLTNQELRPWLLPAVYAREQSGLGEFLTELRPAVALFLRFTGIDYENDPEAGQKLDRFICRVQNVIARYDGALLDLNIGDKGSYLYATFGAPTAHEDDDYRAINAARALQKLPQELGYLKPLQIGLSKGTMRAGAYGGTMRRTYGVMGDEVNLAARLMQAAEPGQILASGRVQGNTLQNFHWQALPSLQVKGKNEPVDVFVLEGEQQRRAIRLQEPKYGLPMVGREAELKQIEEKLEQTLHGNGQVIGIVAEAGMGKSRLVAEVIHLAHQKGFIGFGGACQSDGRNTPYLPWKNIWTTLFELDSTLQNPIPQLTNQLISLAPQRIDALPLLSTLLDISLPDNDFTRRLEPQFRKSTLHALLEDCLRATARATPVLMVLEDVHWIDALSQELLEDLARSISSLPVLLVLAYRPADRYHEQKWLAASLTNFTTISLGELSEAEANQAIQAKFSQLYADETLALPQTLANRLITRAQGNPFYLEELLNYLHSQTKNLNHLHTPIPFTLELPDSLHALILSRIDQLTESEKTTLKVASVIGRVFRASWLSGYYPALGDDAVVGKDLRELAKLDITLLEMPEPELTYLFKHIVTREVAYESLAFTTRTQLHEQFAHYLENIAGEQLDPYLTLLAYHYDLTENLSKRREYLYRAGVAAAARFANADAVDYFTRALELIPSDAPDAKFRLLTARLEIFATTGQREAQRQNLQALMHLAEITQNTEWKVFATVRQTEYILQISDLPGCEKAAEQASHLAQEAGRVDLQALAHYYWATALYQMSNYPKMVEQAELITQLARQIDDPSMEMRATFIIGSAREEQGNYPAAQHHYEQALKFAQTAQDISLESEALFGLGWVTWSLRDYARSRDLFEQALNLTRKIGDRLNEGNVLSGMGTVAWCLGDFRGAWEYHQQMINIYSESTSQAGESLTVNTLGWLAWLEGDFARARGYLERALVLIREVGRRREEGLAFWRLGHVALSEGALDEAKLCYEESVAIRKGLGHQAHLMEAYAGLLRVAVAQHRTGDQTALAWATPIAEEIYQYLSQQIPEGAEAPFWIYLSLFQVLEALNDPRTLPFLQRAGAILTEHANQIPEARVRNRFLTQLPYHRDLILAWKTAS